MLPFQEMSRSKNAAKAGGEPNLLNTLKMTETKALIVGLVQGLTDFFRYRPVVMALCSRNVGITLRRIPKFAHSYCITLRYRPQYDGYL